MNQLVNHPINDLWNKENLEARIDKFLLKEKDQPLQWWWLSFAVPVCSDHADNGFLGGAIIRARGPWGAFMQSCMRNIFPAIKYPSAQAAYSLIPEDELAPEEYRYRLIPKGSEFYEFWQKGKFNA